MKITQIREIAKDMGLKAGKMKKADMIRAIQVAEGNYPCFGSAVDYCDQADCMWREDCMPKK